jgi:hypothetical protein
MKDFVALVMPDSAARRWAPTAIAAVCVAIGVFVVFTALGVGADSRTVPSATPTAIPLAKFSLRTPHVLSTNLIYSVQGLVGDASATPPPELPPTPVSAFDRPIAIYRAYTVAQLGRMEKQLALLESALATNNATTAKSDWRAAYASYLRLGAVYLAGQVATLNQEIDGTASGLVGGTSSPKFAGLHRIEYGLWTGAPPRALSDWAGRLNVTVHKLRGLLPSVSISPLEYATRAHEILEDAVRDLLSGANVPWSDEGVVATEAGLEATEEVISTLRPVLGKTERVIPTVEVELAALRSALSSIAAAHGGRLPSNDQLSQAQSGLLNGRLGGALEALSQVPGVLETETAQQIPQIPPRDARIDP